MKNNEVYWGDGTPWKTKSAYLSYIRGGVRRGLWNRSPIKLGFLNENTIMIDNTNERSKKRFPKVRGSQCNYCKQVFRASEVEVDHIKGNHSLKEVEDICSFVKGIAMVKKDDLQILCKECHRCKTLAESRGITMEEAKVETKVIAFGRLKANKQVAKLKKLGYTPESNAKKRIDQFRKHIFKEGK